MLKRSIKIKMGYTMVALAAGFVVWLVDALFDFFIFYSFDGSFFDMLIKPPGTEILERWAMVVVFTIFGFVLGIFQVDRVYKSQCIVNQRNEYQLLLYSISDAVISTDKNGLICRMNPVAQKIINRDINAIRGLHFDDVFWFSDIKSGVPINGLIDKVVGRRQVERLTTPVMLKMPDGQLFYGVESVSPILIEDSRVEGVVIVIHDMTQHYIFQTELEQKNQQLETAQALGKMGSWEFHLATQKVFASDEARRIYGVDHSTSLTISEVKEFPLKKYRPHLDEAFNNLVEHGVSYCQKFEIEQRESNKILWVESRAHYNAKDNVVTGIIREITDEVRQQQNFLLSEERLRLATEGTNDGLWDWNLITHEAYVSERYADMLGYKKSELPASGDAWIKLLHPDDSASAQNVLHDYLTKKIEEYNSVFRLRTKQGNYKWIHGRGKAVWNQQGKAIRIIGFNTDITEQKEAEIALNKSEDRFYNVLDSSPMGVFIYEVDQNDNLNFVYYNKAANKLLGVESKQYIGKSIGEAFPELLKTDIPDRYKKTALYGDNFHVEVFPYKDNLIDGAFEVHAFQIEYRRVCVMFLEITYRIVAEDKLRESEEKYRLLLNSQTDMVVKVDTEGHFLFVNPSYCLMFGKSEDELIGKSFLPLVHDDDLNQTIEEMKKLYVPPYRCRLRQRVLAQKGWRWVEWQDTALLDDYGKVFEIIGVGRDITDQVEAREELMRSELRNKQIVQELSLGIVIHIENKIEHCNNAMLRLLGVEVQSITGRNILEFIHADDRLKVIDLVGESVFTHRTVSDGELKIVEVRLLNAQGIDTVVEVSVIATHFNEQEALMIVFNDVTLRKEAEKKQLAFTAFIENSRDIIVVKDLNRRVVATNMAFAKAAGRQTIEEMIGKTDAEIFNVPENSEPVKSYMLDDIKAMSLRKGEVIITEEPVIYPGNIRKVFQTRKYPIVDETQTVVAIGIISTDISKQKNAENDLKLKNEEYLAANEELNESLQKIYEMNKELVTAKEKAEESDRLKSAFLANMSHEIRTPMNSILGFAQMLQKPLLTDAKQKKYIEIIRKSGTRMLNTINDLMDISRIEAGHVKIKYSEFKVVDILKYISSVFVDEASVKGLVLKCLAGKGCQVVLHSDKEKVEAIMVNLVKNAIKYTDAGFVHFGCNIDDGFVRFYVADSGIGIAKEKLHAIFDRFVQADIDDKEVREGTGLGLSISSAYVQMLGGKIWVESESGKGSTFNFTIPIKPSTTP